MQNKAILKTAACLIMITLISFRSVQQDTGALTRTQMREMLVQLGYMVKDIVTTPGKEKYSVGMSHSSLDIPVGVEMSPSGRYIWLTVNLGPADSTNTAKNYALLKRNGLIQPVQFYYTSTTKTLMAGLPLENKGITNAHMRERLEYLAAKIGESKSIWQAK